MKKNNKVCDSLLILGNIIEDYYWWRKYCSNSVFFYQIYFIFVHLSMFYFVLICINLTTIKDVLKKQLLFEWD